MEVHAPAPDEENRPVSGCPPLHRRLQQYTDIPTLRHTFITNTMKSGANPKNAQALARHSTIDLTMNVYTSLSVTDQAAAMNTLPGVPVFHSPVTASTASL